MKKFVSNSVIINSMFIFRLLTLIASLACSTNIVFVSFSKEPIR